MKLIKQKLKEIIEEELSHVLEGGLGGHFDEEEEEYEKNWVVRRSGVHDTEAYLGNNWQWGPPEGAWRVEFEDEARGTIKYGLESGKIDSASPVELPPITQQGLKEIIEEEILSAKG
tara:strand:+ start:4166 stop:4516 length:351 start_codon:yes stop_codon:yes gene_type:complete